MIIPFKWPWSSGSSSAQVNADWDATSGAAEVLNKPALFSGNYADLTGKPILFSGNYADLVGKPALFSGNYADLTGRPALSAVAASGSYADLTNKPTIPAAQVASDWNASSGVAAILNKPSIPAAQVSSDWSATSGVSRILNKPALFSGTYADLTGKPVLFSGNYSDLVGRPALAAVATSGAYGDLTGKPAIPAAQVQSDWNASSGLGAILNKPAIPSVKRMETYIGTTDASGLFTVTYPAAFAAIPNVQPEPPSVANYTWIKVSSSTTGFSLRLIQRASITVLGFELLAATFTNVAGAAAKAMVVES